MLTCRPSRPAATRCPTLPSGHFLIFLLGHTLASLHLLLRLPSESHVRQVHALSRAIREHASEVLFPTRYGSSIDLFRVPERVSPASRRPLACSTGTTERKQHPAWHYVGPARLHAGRAAFRDITVYYSHCFYIGTLLQMRGTRKSRPYYAFVCVWGDKEGTGGVVESDLPN